MHLSRAARRAQERRNKKNKLNAQIASVSMLTTMGITLAPGGAFAAVIVNPSEPTVIDACGVANDRSILEANADVVWYQVFTDPDGTETRAEVAGEVAADGLEAEFVAVPANEGDTFADGSAEIRFPVDYTDVACIVVTTDEPVFLDYSGTENDRVDIPETVGVQYFLNGDAVDPGVYDVTGNVEVTAEPEDGYAFAEGTTTIWNDILAAEVTATVVMAEEPVFTDPSGTEDDIITIPEVEGVQYLLDGEVVVAGDYPGVGEVTVEAQALAGYELDPDGVGEWGFIFNEAVTDTVVVPAEPIFTDESGTENDVVVIPESEGVEYSLDGSVVAAGEYPGAGSVVVTANAAAGYDLDPDSPSTWNFTFDAAAAEDVIVSPAEPVFTDLPGIADDEYTIPESEGVQYTVDGEVVAPGTYAGEGTITVEAVALDGFALDPAATSMWNFSFETTMDDTVVSPGEPQFVDESGTANDRLILPESTGVLWFVDDVLTEPGTYEATGTVEVRAEADEGYALDPEATSVWVNTFSAETDAPAEETMVEVVEPTFTEELNVITIPDVEGLRFFLNGEAVAAGSYPITADAVVTATVEEGYTVPEGTVLAWNYAFTAAPVEEPVDAPVDPPVLTPVVIDTPVVNAPVNPPVLSPVANFGDTTGDDSAVGGADNRTLADTGANAGLIVLLGAGGLLTAAGAGTVISGRRRKGAEG